MNLVMTTPAPASPEDRYHPELAHARRVMRRPDLYTNAEIMARCRYAREHGNWMDQCTAIELERATERAIQRQKEQRLIAQDATDRDPRLTAIVGLCLLTATISSVVVAFILWGIPLTAAFIQWGGTIVRGVL